MVVDDVRLRALAADVDLDAVRTSAEAVVTACRHEHGSARENNGLATRFGMLTAPRSTVVQPSPVHAGDHRESRTHAEHPADQTGRPRALSLSSIRSSRSVGLCQNSAMLRVDSHYLWDSWMADDGELYHLFFLMAPRSLGTPAKRHVNATVGRASSRDLINWDYHGECFGPSTSSGNGDSAPAAIRRPGDLDRLGGP